MRSRAVVVVVALAAFGVVAAPGHAAPRCTKVGTNSNDNMNGTARQDVLCTLRGNDYARGRSNSDVLRGSRGSDTLVGDAGSDRIYGGQGADDIFVTDGTTGDWVSGGGGRDNCYGDLGDAFSRCEHVVTVTNA